HAYFFSDPREYDPAGAAKHFADANILQHLREYTDDLSRVDAFEPQPLEAHLRAWCETRQLAAGKLIHPIRLALTGKIVSPSLFELMAILGRDTVLRRLSAAIKFTASP
ncbi:MAG: glutamate--tRNA ligase, partial [bacterium]|nr:glutamate--tRNA ligase [bacterium]